MLLKVGLTGTNWLILQDNYKDMSSVVTGVEGIQGRLLKNRV